MQLVVAAVLMGAGLYFHFFRPRRQGAEVEGVQKLPFTDPVAPVHHLPVQQRDLPGRAAKGQQADAEPDPEGMLQ